MGVCAFPPSKLSLGENAEGTATCPSFTAATENMTIHLNTKNGSPDSGRRLFHCFEFLFLLPFYVSYRKNIRLYLEGSREYIYLYVYNISENRNEQTEW